jgi:hypothetical protein
MPDGRSTTNSDFMAFDEIKLKFYLKTYEEYEGIDIAVEHVVDSIKSGNI